MNIAKVEKILIEWSEEEFFSQTGVTKCLFKEQVGWVEEKENEEKRGRKSIFSAMQRVYIYWYQLKNYSSFRSIGLDIGMQKSGVCKMTKKIAKIISEKIDQINNKDKDIVNCNSEIGFHEKNIQEDTIIIKKKL